MKFGKDQIQKMVLSALLLAFLVYAYFAVLLGPLMTQQEAVKNKTLELTPKIEAADKLIKQSAANKIRSVGAQDVIKQLNAMIPEGAPVAWFPPRVAEFYKARNVDKVTTRLVGMSPDKNLPGYVQSGWSLEFPKVEFAPFGKALAEFENAELLVEITNFAIEINRDDVESQHVTMTLNSIVKK